VHPSHLSPPTLVRLLSPPGDEFRWAKAQVAAASPKDAFWQHVGAVLSQFDGLVEGYSYVSGKGDVPPINRFGFQVCFFGLFLLSFCFLFLFLFGSFAPDLRPRHQLLLPVTVRKTTHRHARIHMRTRVQLVRRLTTNVHAG